MPKGELVAHRSLHAAGRGGAVGAGDRRRRQQGDARAVRGGADTPEKMVALGEAKVRDLIKTIGLFRTKAKNVIALSQKLDRRARRRGAARRARRSRRCPASAARPPMSCSTSRSASRPSRSTPTSSASATAPGWRRARRRSRSSRSSSRWCRTHYKLPCPPLADPARPLHLRGAPAAVRKVPDRRPLQMAGQDRRGVMPPRALAQRRAID